MVHVVQPPELVAELLTRYTESGGVLEFVFMNADDDGESTYRLHLDAAINALIEVRNRIDRWAESLTQEPNITRDQLFKVEVPRDFVPAGNQISLAEFLGPLYSVKEGFRQRLEHGFSGAEMCGFGHAIMVPPYHMTDPMELFLEFKRHVFEDFPNDAAIWQWDTNGLNYFDAGREWWGAFYWTYRASQQSCIIGILGSATD